MVKRFPSSNQRESQIQSAVCDYLAYRRLFFWRQNNAPAVNKRDGAWSFRRMPKHSRRGVPDIIVVKDGGFRARSEATRHVVRSIADVQALGL